jgi:hypothetical protein
MDGKASRNGGGDTVFPLFLLFVLFFFFGCFSVQVIIISLRHSKQKDSYVVSMPFLAELSVFILLTGPLVSRNRHLTMSSRSISAPLASTHRSSRLGWMGKHLVMVEEIVTVFPLLLFVLFFFPDRFSVQKEIA